MAEEIDDEMLEIDSNGRDGDSEENNSGGKLARIKALLSNRIILISIISVLIILLAVGAYFIFFTGNDEATDTEITELSGEVATQPDMMAPPQSEDNSSAFLSAISENSNSPDSEQISNSDGTDGDKPSRVSQISNGMVEAAKTGGFPTADSASGAANTVSDQMPAETPESKQLSELLNEKVAELEAENQRLKQQISNLDIQIKLYKNAKRAEDLSIPVDRFDSNAITSPAPYNDGLVNDFSSDYSASPYADDEMTPKPTWGDAKPDQNK